MNDRYWICESHTGMSFRLMTNPANSYDTKMNSGAIVTAVSFCLKAADIIREALPAALKIKKMMTTTRIWVMNLLQKRGNFHHRVWLSPTAK